MAPPQKHQKNSVEDMSVDLWLAFLAAAPPPEASVAVVAPPPVQATVLVQSE
jgi:hypothetical protein